MNTADMIEALGENTQLALEWHLAHNHYPPVPASMVAACAEAIDHAVAGDWYAEVALPDGITYRNKATAPVHAVVEQHHLLPFVYAAIGDDE